MKKLITTAMVAVLGLFGAIEDGRVTLVSSAFAQATPQQVAKQQVAKMKIALRARLNDIVQNNLTGRDALEKYLEHTPLAASLVADVLATLPQGQQDSIAYFVGGAMANAQIRLIANGSDAALKAATYLAQEVFQMPQALQQTVTQGFNDGNGNIQFYGGNAGGGQGGGQQGGNNNNSGASGSNGGGRASGS